MEDLIYKPNILDLLCINIQFYNIAPKIKIPKLSL